MNAAEMPSWMMLRHRPVDNAMLTLARERGALTAQHALDAGVTTHIVVARASLRRLARVGLLRRDMVSMLGDGQRRRVAICTATTSAAAATLTAQIEDQIIDLLRKRGVLSTPEVIEAIDISPWRVRRIMRRLRRNGTTVSKRSPGDGALTLHWLAEASA